MYVSLLQIRTQTDFWALSDNKYTYIYVYLQYKSTHYMQYVLTYTHIDTYVVFAVAFFAY